MALAYHKTTNHWWFCVRARFIPGLRRGIKKDRVIYTASVRGFLLDKKYPRQNGVFFYLAITLIILVLSSAPVKRLVIFLENFTTPFAVAYKVLSPPILTFRPGRNLLPRCLTMILPVFTFCPPKILTPSRFETLSRPKAVEPPAFLCAISVSP